MGLNGEGVPATPPSASERIEVVDALRGLAALAVCWFHMTNGNPSFLEPGWVKTSGAAGWLGVDVFFVLSGFVIPLSLRRGGFRPRADFGRFLAKRLVRLEPPYLASLALVLLLGWLSARASLFHGSPFTPSWQQVGAHLGYLNAFVGLPWLNPVYWTLAIEFQFYLFVALTFGVVASERPVVRLASVPAILALGFLSSSPAFLLLHLPLFALGITAFQVRERLLPTSAAIAFVGLAVAAATLRLGPARAGAGLVTALVVLFAHHVPARGFVWLGDVSYSLYLLHVPIGGRVVNLLHRALPQGPIRPLGALVAAAVSVFCAWLFWRAVERPARKLASAIRYGRGGHPMPGVSGAAPAEERSRPE